MSTVARPKTIEELAQRYGQAWNDHDLEAIVSLHTPDATFRLHGGGKPMTWSGVEELRKAYDYLLRAWPDQHFTVKNLLVRDGFYACESIVTATLAEPWTVGDIEVQPRRQKVEFEILDNMTVANGLIADKSSWFDGLAIRNQLAAQE